MNDATKQLHDHLKSTGTGATKLKIVEGAASADEAISKLDSAGHQGTAQKGRMWLAAQQKAAADKAAQQKAAADKKAEQDRIASEKAAADKAAQQKAGGKDETPKGDAGGEKKDDKKSGDKAGK
jgi:glucose-1-phosphatase